MSSNEKQAIEIKGLTTYDVHDIVQRIIEHEFSIRDRVETIAENLIEKHVSEVLQSTIKEKLEAEVVRAISEGFPKFDPYSGREIGRTSVAEVVHKALSERSDSYNDKGTLAERAVRTAVAKLFESELKPTIEGIKADFRKQADAVFQAKLVEGLKGALGLK